MDIPGLRTKRERPGHSSAGRADFISRRAYFSSPRIRSRTNLEHDALVKLAALGCPAVKAPAVKSQIARACAAGAGLDVAVPAVEQILILTLNSEKGTGEILAPRFGRTVDSAIAFWKDIPNRVSKIGRA